VQARLVHVLAKLSGVILRAEPEQTARLWPAAVALAQVQMVVLIPGE
jgi:hypothetical protein